jgi:hypothetical protein
MGPSPPSSRKKWLSIYQKSNAIGQKEKGIQAKEDLPGQIRAIP